MPFLSCFRGGPVSNVVEQQQEVCRAKVPDTSCENDSPQVKTETIFSKASVSAAQKQELRSTQGGLASGAKDRFIPFIHLLATLDGGWWSTLSEACQATHQCFDADHACVYVLSSADLWATVAACTGLGQEAMAGRAYSCDPRFNGSAASLIHKALRENASEHPVIFRSAPPPASSGSLPESGETALALAFGRLATDELPGDWQVLYEDHGCRHFAAVGLAAASGELVGVLSVAAKGASRPASWTPEALHTVVGLLAGPIRKGQAVLASSALSQLHSAGTFSDLVQAAAEAAVEVASSVTYVKGSSRVAVIDLDLNAAAIFQQKHLQQEGDPLASVGLLKARRSSCEFVLMPAALRKSITTNTFPRLSEDGLATVEERAEGLKRESWGTQRPMSTPQGNASFTLAFLRGVPCKGHTLSLDKTLLGEALSKQVAGLCIDDCQAHTVSTKAYPRDLILSRGAVMPLSLALATISCEERPLLGLYVTFDTTLPRPMLQAVVQELGQLLQAISPTIRAKLGGVIKAEYEYLARQLEGAASRRKNPPNTGATKPGQSGLPSGELDRGSITLDFGGEQPARGGSPSLLSFVLKEENAQGGGAAPLVNERPSPLYAPPTPTAASGSPAHHNTLNAEKQQSGGVAAAAIAPPLPSSTSPQRSFQEGAAVVAAGLGGASTRPQSRSPSPSPSTVKKQSPLAVAAAATATFAAATAAAARLSATEGPPKGGSGALEGDIEIEFLGRPRAGQQLQRVQGQPEASGRSQSACEGGGCTNRRLLNSLSSMRSVSFHLEKAQAPRGASKLAPIIATVHDRLQRAQAVQMAFSRSEARKADLQSVKLLQEIGQGGYGIVYRGTYHGAEVAIKVIKQSRLTGVHSSSNALVSSSTATLGLHKQHLHDAIELVASVSMSHINIVQVPAYFMDVRLEKPEDFNPLDSVDQPTESRPFRLMHSPSLLESPAPGQEQHGFGEGAMALVLEYCDCGSLCDAIMSRKFIEKVTPKKDPSGGAKTYLAINMRSVYSTLLEVALALRHMHSLALVHCDLKPQNVLLKSSPRDPRGFTAKLSDFGLAKMMAHDDQGQLVIDEAVASGTITHVAPEVLLGQQALGAAVDIYAFGIMMFQVLCGMKVYDRTLSPSGIANAVAHGRMRPQIPTWVPANYRLLAKRCWSHDPSERPTADELVRQLESILESKLVASRQQPPPPPPAQQQAPQQVPQHQSPLPQQQQQQQPKKQPLPQQQPQQLQQREKQPPHHHQQQQQPPILRPLAAAAPPPRLVPGTTPTTAAPMTPMALAAPPAPTRPAAAAVAITTVAAVAVAATAAVPAGAAAGTVAGAAAAQSPPALRR